MSFMVYNKVTKIKILIKKNKTEGKMWVVTCQDCSIIIYNNIMLYCYMPY